MKTIRGLLKEIFFIFLLSLFVISLPFFLGRFAVKDLSVLFVGFHASEEVREVWNENHGLKGPIGSQYINYLRTVISGDLGQSYLYKTEVLKIISKRWKPTFALTFLALFISILWSLLLTVLFLIIKRKKPRWQNWLQILIAVGYTPLPVVVFLIRKLFEEKLSISVVASGELTLKSLVVGSACLAILPMVLITHLMLSAVGEELVSPRIQMAKSCGLGWLEYLFYLGWRPIIAKIIGVLRPMSLYCLSFSFFSEYAFRIEGLGALIVDASLNADLPLLSASMLFPLIMLIIISRVLKICELWLDPRGEKE
jgi:ABC-type dipeptide/oligopeptide/nickel transport system permease component